MPSTTDATRTEADDPTVADAPEHPAEPAREEQRWTILRVTRLLAPALIYLGIRELGLLVLSLMTRANEMSTTDVLQAWDGRWFLQLTERGYDGVVGLTDAHNQVLAVNSMAFFPGYPVTARLVANLTGISAFAAASTLTVVSGVFCAYGIARLGRQVRGGSERVGLILVALFAASPMAIVLSMTYSEAMFCALAAWSLVGVLERRWVLAGVCCGIAGLVRPTAAALILAVGLAALVAVIQRRDSWRPWIAGLLAPVGLISYLAWVGARTGRWDGWFALQQAGWDSGFDGGAATTRWILRRLAQPDYPFEIATVGFIAVALVISAIAIARRLEWPLLVYGLGVLAMDLTANGLMASKTRLMLPAFTLLIPVAIALARRRTATMVIVLSALAVFSSWFGAYAITSWNFAI
ncbi:hypothetical protein [Actinophytocola sp.]|uniref:hypothetical protein n=1 Tax=Actinophytocola sp. TaxID=1872138 RepID=UPI002D7F43AA|nr:hypothetical protein [Actinophytocola sp.]HET9143401.1 hypothetical protein [Actinophytocola sp.]